MMTDEDRLDKHVSAETNKHATTDEFLETVLHLQSVQAGIHELRVSRRHELVVRLSKAGNDVSRSHCWNPSPDNDW
jgi:transcriptional regulator of NAD metabolism